MWRVDTPSMGAHRPRHHPPAGPRCIDKHNLASTCGPVLAKSAMRAGTPTPSRCASSVRRFASAVAVRACETGVSPETREGRLPSATDRVHSAQRPVAQALGPYCLRHSGRHGKLPSPGQSLGYLPEDA